MCDIDKDQTIAQKHNLKNYEDCAHCIEGSRDGIRLALGDIACYSFMPPKI